MRIYSLVILLFGIIWPSIPLHGQDLEGFVLVKQQGALALFERWVTYPQTNPPIKSREIKAEFFYDGKLFAGLHLLRDERKIHQWQSLVSEFKIYHEQDTTKWYEYAYHDIPWPVSDQDHFMEYKFHRKSARLLFISFSSVINERLAPQRKGVTRLELTGSWSLEQISRTRVKVTYRVLSKPIGIPKVFTDPIIRSNILTTLEQYINLLEKR